jgi:hypothetical protein
MRGRVFFLIVYFTSAGCELAKQHALGERREFFAKRSQDTASIARLAASRFRRARLDSMFSASTAAENAIAA